MVIMQVLCRIMNLTFFVKTLNFLRVKSKVNVKVFLLSVINVYQILQSFCMF